jgi:hypothetical protein
MARTNQSSGLEAQGKLDSYLAIAELFRAIPRAYVDEALKSIDRSKHRLGKFPDYLVVYFVILMCLYMDDSYLQIFEALQGALSWLSCFELGMEGLSEAAISKARRRIGYEPLKQLFLEVTPSMLNSSRSDKVFGKYRKFVMDGTVLDVADTPENSIFGSRSNQIGPGAYPQLRLVALMDYASRLIIDFELSPFRGTGEIPLAKLIAERLSPDSLVIADRNFPGTELCEQIIERGAHFVFRVKNSITLAPLKYLPDGSYTARLNQSSKKGFEVRVVEYSLSENSEKYRIITSLFDSETAAAEDLARLYPQRWTAETIFGDIKNVLRAPKLLLRSKTPNAVAQECCGLILAYNFVRSFMSEAAERAGVPPSLLSFKYSVSVLKNQLHNAADFPPLTLQI